MKITQSIYTIVEMTIQLDLWHHTLCIITYYNILYKLNNYYNILYKLKSTVMVTRFHKTDPNHTSGKIKLV